MPGPFSRLRRKSGDDAPTSNDATEVLPAETVAAPAETVEVTEVTVVHDGPAVEGDAEPEPEGDPRFLARGKLRRRLRYVRRAREIALRDLGGLVFDLHRFGRDRSDLVEQKLTALGALDAEMRSLGEVLGEPAEVTVLREPGLASCPRCGALRASDASFCASCGLPLGKGAGLPTAPTAAGAAPPAQSGGGSGAATAGPDGAPAAPVSTGGASAPTAQPPGIVGVATAAHAVPHAPVPSASAGSGEQPLPEDEQPPARS